MSVVDTLAALKGLSGASALSPEDYFRAAALGWCIEWLQAFFLVADDIMDDSITRRGQPCWYRVPRVGTIAINDGIVLEAHIYRVLKRHFAALPCYAALLELFHDITYQTSMGQLLDLITAPAGKADLNNYTRETYINIVVHKTAWYSFYLPVACAMQLEGLKEAKAYKVAEARVWCACEACAPPFLRGGVAAERAGAYRAFFLCACLNRRPGHPDRDGDLLPDPGRRARLLRRARGHRQDRHRHRGAPGPPWLPSRPRPLSARPTPFPRP